MLQALFQAPEVWPCATQTEAPRPPGRGERPQALRTSGSEAGGRFYAG